MSVSDVHPQHRQHGENLSEKVEKFREMKKPTVGHCLYLYYGFYSAFHVYFPPLCGQGYAFTQFF